MSDSHSADGGQVRPNGKSLFRAANLVLLLLGLIHLLAVYRSSGGTHPDPRMAEFQRVAQSIDEQMGPFRATAWGGVQILNASYSILVLQVAVLNWLAVPGWVASRRFRAATWANVVFVGLLLAVTVVYQFPPPMIFLAVALLLLVASLLRQAPGRF